ncbi:hypothetical protein V6N12_033081 [Hibiscus sabdariffa]|uniref:Uncharacterized protein n=1 Tax=Hibiscus sabdariffa TaxID=183260 RepID=A0ABR2BCH2_9ROSI
MVQQPPTLSLARQPSTMVPPLAARVSKTSRQRCDNTTTTKGIGARRLIDEGDRSVHPQPNSSQNQHRLTYVANRRGKGGECYRTASRIKTLMPWVESRGRGKQRGDGQERHGRG